jgi:ParB family chromosome partitioning protein
MKSTQENVELVPLSRLVVRKNIRTTFDDEKLRELADSIKQRGVLHPIICRRSNGKLELIAGERRVRAAKMAGLAEIPAIIKEADDSEVTFDRIIENLQREDLSDEDQYRALKMLRESGMAVSRIAKMTGLSTTTIDRVLVLETLKPSIRKRPDVTRYAKAFIARAPDHIQDDLAERVAAGVITSKQLGHDVMPAITETLEEEVFSEAEKKQVIRKIASEASAERPARAIVRQERGKKKLQREGADVEIASNQALKELLDLSQRYHDKLMALHATRFDHLDPGLVMGLVNLFRQVHAILGDVLRSVEIARRRR